MKLRISDRIGIVLLALVGLCVSAFGGFCAWNVWNEGYSSTFCPPGYSARAVAAVYAAVALLVLVLSIRMVVVAFRRREKVDKGSVSVQHTGQGNGEVRVSVQALDALVKQAIVGHNEGVADIKTRIINHEDSVSVRIEMSLNGDVHIPNLTMLLQNSIKSFIEEFSGIAVRDVSIMVTTIIPVNPQLAIAAQAAPQPVVIEAEEVTVPAIETAEPEDAAPQEPVYAEETAEEEPAEEEATAVEQQASVPKPDVYAETAEESLPELEQDESPTQDEDTL